MSAPHTNVEKQKRRHRGPLIGMALVVVFGVGLIVAWLFDESYNARSPDLDPSLPSIDSGVPAGSSGSP